MTSEAYRTLSNALDVALSRPSSHWVSAGMSVPVTFEGEDVISLLPSSAEVSQESGADEPLTLTEPRAESEATAQTPSKLRQFTHAGVSNTDPQPIAEPSQEMPRFLRDTLDLEDATASLRLLRLIGSALDTPRPVTQPDPQLAPTPTAPEKRHFKYWPEAALTTAALICLCIFFWLDRGPSSLTSSDFFESRRSGVVSRLNFVGIGGCVGKACETLVTVKTISEAELSKTQLGGSIATTPIATAPEKQSDQIAAEPPAQAPAGVIVSTADDEIGTQGELPGSQPAIMNHALHVRVPDQAETATPEASPDVAHNLNSEPLPELAPEASLPTGTEVQTQGPPAPKTRNAGTPKEPRRLAVTPPAQKPISKSAKPATPKRGLAEVNPAKVPPPQKLPPASKASPPVVATAKPAEETTQSAQWGDPAPGFQILNNLNNNFFSFQP